MPRPSRAAVVLLIVSLFAPFGGAVSAQDGEVPAGIPSGVEAGQDSSHQGGVP